MKKVILFFFFVSNIFVGKSQLQLPFPDSTGAWITVYEEWDLSSSYYTINGFRHYIHGDTIIGLFSYHKLYQATANLTDSVSFYVGGFRQDSLKIYFLGSHLYESYVPFTEEILLYDFSLKENDTLYAYGCYLSGDSGLVVESIDSVLINSNYYKRWNFHEVSPGNTPVWIEGVGSNNGFFPYYFGPCPLQSNYNLACFNEHSEVYVHNLFGANDCSSVGLWEFGASNSEIQIYPNPTSGQFNLELLDNEFNGKLIIQDAMGRLILEKEINQATTTIDLSTRVKGLYFITVIDEEKSSTLKLVVE